MIAWRYLGAERRRAAVHQVDALRDLLRGQHALLDQQRSHRLFEHFIGAGRPGVVVPARRMRMLVPVVMIATGTVHRGLSRMRSPLAKRLRMRS